VVRRGHAKYSCKTTCELNRSCVTVSVSFDERFR
jgi:hypothetical protein